MTTVYTTEDGTPYTKDDIMQDIRLVLNRDLGRHFLEYSRKNVETVLYQYVMSLLEWQHPVTVLEELCMSEEEIRVIKERLEGKR